MKGNNKIGLELVISYLAYLLITLVFPTPTFFDFFTSCFWGLIEGAASLCLAYFLVMKFYAKKSFNFMAAFRPIVLVRGVLFALDMLAFAFGTVALFYVLRVLGFIWPIAALLLIGKGVGASAGKGKTTLYRKERIIQKGSQAENILNNLFIIAWVGGAIFTWGGFIVRPRSQAPAFYLIGFALLAFAITWTKRKIDDSKVESFQTIVTPENWPEDCQFDYAEGLHQKKSFKLSNANEKFYNKCTSEGVKSLDTARDIQKAILIAQNMKRKDCSEAAIREAFEAGKQDAVNRQNEEQRIAASNKMAESRVAELKVLEGAMQYYGYHGQDKRIAMLRDMIADARKKLKDARFMQQYVSRSMLQKEIDWATHGGIASGIAGPAAGLARAMEIQQKNATIREYNAQMAPYVAMVSSSYASSAEGYEQTIARFQSDLEKTKLALVSPETTAEVYQHLHIDDVQYVISETGAVVIEADFNTSKNYKIYDTVEPTIDGTVAARIFENGIQVGSAYFVFPVDGVAEKVRLASICTKTTKRKADYEIKFEPVDVWAIEKLK